MTGSRETIGVLGAGPGAAGIDRGARPRVGNGVRRMLSIALALAVAGCGSKPKNAKTTPTGGVHDGSSTGHMADTGPDGADLAPGGGGDEGGGGPVAGGGGGDEAGGDQGPSAPITPPNLDPSPEQAKAAVDKHLHTGRAALEGAKPDPDLALREAQAALAVESTNVDAVALMALAYYHKHLYETSEVILDMLFKDRPVAKKNADVYYVYGLIYDKTDRPKQARKAYEQAVQIKPDFTSALINLGVHQLGNKQYADAITTYEKVTGPLGVANATTYTDLGDAYRGHSADYDPSSADRAQLLRKAETSYKRAIDRDRNFAAAYYDLGVLYLDGDDFPGGGGGTVDKLVRLNRAKTYFDQYKDMPGADQNLYDDRAKDVRKLIKREEKARKRKAKAQGGG
jgi:tetratricopeptide (TPR) repeat protein